MEVVIDRKVLDGFKKRALLAYPNEYIETLWGKVCGDQVHVYVIRDLDHEAHRRQVHYDPEDKHNDDLPLTMLGDIHTHPNSPCEPSPCDKKQFKKEGDVLMGIMSIRKRNGRRFTAVNFWNQDGAAQLTISEPHK